VDASQGGATGATGSDAPFLGESGYGFAVRTQLQTVTGPDENIAISVIPPESGAVDVQGDIVSLDAGGVYLVEFGAMAEEEGNPQPKISLVDVNIPTALFTLACTNLAITSAQIIIVANVQIDLALRSPDAPTVTIPLTDPAVNAYITAVRIADAP
jgi:hypothetical protein